MGERIIDKTPPKFEQKAIVREPSIATLKTVVVDASEGPKATVGIARGLVLYRVRQSISWWSLLAQ